MFNFSQMTVKTRFTLLQIPLAILSAAVCVIAWEALHTDTYDWLMAAYGTRLAVEYNHNALKMSNPTYMDRADPTHLDRLICDGLFSIFCVVNIV